MTLAADIITDLGTMIDTDEFGVSATLGATTIDVVFDNGYAEELDVAGSKPTATCKASDIASVSRGDTITIPVGGTAYTIQNIQPDGAWLTILVLDEQDAVDALLLPDGDSLLLPDGEELLLPGN